MTKMIVVLAVCAATVLAVYIMGRMADKGGGSDGEAGK